MQHNFTLNGMQYLAIIIVTLHAVRGANFRGSQHLALETTPNLMNKPARNLPLMGPDGPDEFDPETLPKWMKPTVGDDSDQGGNVANRESPNRYRKKLASLPPIESAGAKAVYGGNFFGDGKKPIMYTPDGPHGGDGKLSHMLHPPSPYKVLPGGGIVADESTNDGKMGQGPASVFLTPPKEGEPKHGPLGMYDGAPITMQKTMGKPANLAVNEFAQNALGPTFK